MEQEILNKHYEAVKQVLYCHPNGTQEIQIKKLLNLEEQHPNPGNAICDILGIDRRGNRRIINAALKDSGY